LKQILHFCSSSTGQPVVRFAVKPTSSILSPLAA